MGSFGVGADDVPFPRRLIEAIARLEGYRQLALRFSFPFEADPFPLRRDTTPWCVAMCRRRR